MRRRRYLTASTAVTVSILGPSSVITASSQERDTELEAISESHRFDGTGATVTDEFDLETGVTIAEATHDGESNFVVELIPTDDSRSQLLVNTIGAYDGAAGVLTDTGRYLVDIDADGAWALEVGQPDPEEDDAESLPVELEGDSAAWDGPFQFEGLGQAHGTHEGQGNFIVEILPHGGRFPGLVFNELDQFDGETTFNLDSIGFVTVEAAGPWSLTLE
ncbi:hypothetical protein [Natrialba sp. INN-245]|uniref:hypothetical protein n=1 Tax=Natrialba sp. INN-245 TaxID=2690967 RepID=UPI001311062F|nr:hypothetical protein [Natrialba sp. INN-245]MWV40462.1 hypothetical protein [Natrialba sp. INN-245]